MNKTIKTKFAAILGMLAIAASAHAGTFGAGLKTPGYEDVVILDNATYQIVTGADDGVVANFLAGAHRNAQMTPPNKGPISLTERVFAKYLPGPSLNIAPPKGVELQNMLLKRKEDVVNAKRFLLSMQLTPAFDEYTENANRDRLVLRDNLGRYVLMLRTNKSINAAYWVQDSASHEVSFLLCQDTNSSAVDSAFQSQHGRTASCLGIPEFKGLNLPAGVFVSDLSKFGDLAWMKSQDGTSTIRAGLVITPDGRSGTAGSRTGRNFAASELVIWDAATMQVLAGPFSLKGKNPNLVYATNNCQKTTSGLSIVMQLPGNCDKLNPTLNPKRMFEMQYE